MRALFSSEEPGTVPIWREVEPPRIEHSSDALLRPLAVAACDLDKAIVHGSSPFPGAFMLGHEFVAEVVEVGEAVRRFAPGEVVLASFQPACGTCPTCGRGASSVCDEVGNGTMYGIGPTGGDWGGAFADALRVPWADFNLIAVPDGVAPHRLASGSDNLADGLRAVDGPLKRRPNASVLIAGRGSIPLYAVLCAQHLGASVVTVASDDPFVLETAASMGADSLEISTWSKRLPAHDITHDCTNLPEGLSVVLRSTAPYGECTSSSIYFKSPIEVPMFHMNMLGIAFHTGRVNSASALPRVMELIQEGLDPDRIDPAYWGWEDAVEGLASEPFSRKVVVCRDD